MIHLLALGIVISVFCGTASAQLSDPADIRGDGSWKTDGVAKRAAQRWNLDLRRADDGTISGLITVTDSPLLQAGRIHGRIDGRTISGTILGDQGEYVARFNGLLNNGRFQGKYTDRTGETGEWEWEGEPPQ